jgi:hypothetical protein
VGVEPPAEGLAARGHQGHRNVQEGTSALGSNRANGWRQCFLLTPTRGSSEHPLAPGIYIGWLALPGEFAS